MTTRSAVLTSSIRFLVRPARSLSQPLTENASFFPGVPANDDAVRKVALLHCDPASCLIAASLGRSSAMTLTARAFEFGASMRKRASAAVAMRALSLSTVVASDRRVRDARLHLQRFPGGVLERLVRRQHHRGRAHAL